MQAARHLPTANFEFIDRIAEVLHNIARGQILKRGAEEETSRERAGKEHLLYTQPTLGYGRESQWARMLSGSLRLPADAISPTPFYFAGLPLKSITAVLQTASVCSVLAIDPTGDWVVGILGSWRVDSVREADQFSLCRLDSLDKITCGRLAQQARVYRVT